MLYPGFLCLVDQILCAVDMDPVKTVAFLFFYYADEMNDRIAVIELAFKTFTVCNVPEGNVETRLFADPALFGRPYQTNGAHTARSECAHKMTAYKSGAAGNKEHHKTGNRQ